MGLAAVAARRDRRNAVTDGAEPTSVDDDTTSYDDTATSRPRSRVRVIGLIPTFLIGFLVVAAVNSAGLIPAGAHSALNEVSVFLITVAVSAVGLSTDVVGLRRTGPRPLILGATLWA